METPAAMPGFFFFEFAPQTASMRFFKCAFSHSAHQQILIRHSARGGAPYIGVAKQKSFGTEPLLVGVTCSNHRKR
jgi:hypothetical protein